MLAHKIACDITHRLMSSNDVCFCHVRCSSVITVHRLVQAGAADCDRNWGRRLVQPTNQQPQNKFDFKERDPAPPGRPRARFQGPRRQSEFGELPLRGCFMPLKMTRELQCHSPCNVVMTVECSPINLHHVEAPKSMFITGVMEPNSQSQDAARLPRLRPCSMPARWPQIATVEHHRLPPL